MQTTSLKTLKILLLVGLVALVTALLILTSQSPLKVKLLKKFPVPFIWVGNLPIYSNEFFYRLSLLPLESQTLEVKQNLLKQLVFEKQLKLIFSSKTSALQNANRFLQTSETAYSSRSLKLAGQVKAQTDAYKFWFNSQTNLNTEAYRRAEYILTKLNEASEFDDLAKQYNQDNLSKELNGDLGYVKLKAVLWELQEPLAKAEVNQVLLLPSRKGLHILKVQNKKPVENQETMLYLKQIFIQPADFSAWVNTQSKKIKIISLLKIYE